MINLRFHIVSITAVFLSLAIGIFMGTSLLNGATVDRLEDRQNSLRDKIAAREAENEAFRAQLRLVDRGDKAFSSQLLPVVVKGTISGPVMVIAARGVDPDVVRAAETALVAAGATSYGIAWIDQRLDLTVADKLSAAEQSLGLTATGSASNRRSAVIASLAAALAGAPVPTGGATTTTSTSSTSVPLDPALGPDGLQPAEAVVPLDVWDRLRTSELIDWRLEPVGGTLPGPTLKVVLVSGEGAELPGDKLLRPLIGALAGARQGAAVVAEAMDSRSAVDDALRGLDKSKPQRGAFITPIREDERLDGRLSTVDDLDRAEGLVAVVFAVRDLPAKVGDYGIVGDTDGPYPPALP